MDFIAHKLYYTVVFFLSLVEIRELYASCLPLWIYKAKDLCFRGKGLKDSEGQQAAVMEWGGDNNV